MDENHDELDARLARFDPVLDDPAPVPDSPRFHTIKEQIMTTTIPEPTRDIGAQRNRPTERRSARRYRALAAVAAVVVMVGLGLAAVLPGGTPGAEAQLLIAAENSTEITDLRIEATSDHEEMLAQGGLTVEIDGENAHLIGDEVEIYQIGDDLWTSHNGTSFEIAKNPAFVRLAPFTQASSSLITTALRSGSVHNQSSDDVRGTPTTRYVIDLDDRVRADISELPANVLAWFVMYHSETTEEDGVITDQDSYYSTERADQLVVWVANDLVHQIEVVSEGGSTRYTFFDIGEDITISPPLDTEG